MTGTFPYSLNEKAHAVHAANQHWWHDPATGKPLDRNVGEIYMLMVSEVAEAMEGERKSLMDNHLPHRPMPEVEMADLCIRVFDYAGAMRLDLDSLDATSLPQDPTENRGAHLMGMVYWLTMGMLAMVNNDREVEALDLASVLHVAAYYCSIHDYDLLGAIEEKLAFNRTRPDHTNEARLADGGKKW